MSIILNIFFIFSVSFANETTKCQNSFEKVVNTQIQQQYFSKSNECWMSVKSADNISMLYRSFLFTENGLLMVFNSYGDGDVAKDTGAREYYLFPRLLHPSYKISSDNLSLNLSNNKMLIFNAQNASPQFFDGVDFDLDPKVSPDNNGGFEIKKYNGVYIDVGFSLGRSPSSHQQNYSVIKDSNNKTCTVKNIEIFKYSGSGDTELKFKNDKDFKVFLKKDVLTFLVRTSTCIKDYFLNFLRYLQILGDH